MQEVRALYLHRARLMEIIFKTCVRDCAFWGGWRRL